MRGDSNPGLATQAKPNYKKIDRDVYRDNITAVNNAGYRLDGLKEQYQEIPFAQFGTTYKFGASLEDLSKLTEIYSGDKGTASKYVNNRVEILNQVIGLLQGAKSPEDLHMINAFMEMSLKAANTPEKAAHYQEIIAAAQEALSNDKEAKDLLRDYPKSFLYDPGSLSKTINELIRRREHLVAIQRQGFSADGFISRGADHIATDGLEAAGVGATSYSLFKGAKGALLHYKDGVDGVKTLQELEVTNAAKHIAEQEKFLSNVTCPNKLAQIQQRINNVKLASGNIKKAGWLSKTLRGTGKGMKWAWKALGAFGPTGKFVALGVAATYAVALGISSCNNEESVLNNIGSTIKETYMGNAKNGWAAFANWTLPFYEHWGPGMKDSKTEALTKLQQQGVLA